MSLAAQLSQLLSEATREDERKVADRFKGIGPKQSRNILQTLGLSRYEIAVDSRITKWLNELGFGFRVSANPLGDPHYYGLVLDGFNALCEAAGVYPCELDAAIFVSFDPKK